MSQTSGSLLRLSGLSKRYPGGDLALSGVNLEVPRGQVIFGHMAIPRNPEDAAMNAKNRYRQ
ncbi:MAG TPA: hypothetical protein VLA17_05005, partial [Candidatus Limnocylindria bacterium]|nr:hypothetical protein [Candidatus Limnocylindria bacterium]